MHESAPDVPRPPAPADREAARRLDPDLGRLSAFVPLPFHWTWARWLWRRLVAAGRTQAPNDVAVAERDDGPLPLRTYRPVRTPGGGADGAVEGAAGGAADEGAALLWLHGGGLMLGTPRMDDARSVALARNAGVVIVAPAYRLAPEHRFPAALDDAHAAWTWLLEHARDLGADRSRLAIGGASAGAGLAACLAQRLRDEAGPQPAAQLLVYPMLDDRTAARRALDAVQHLVWTNRADRAGWRAYLGVPPGAAELPPYAAAARCDDLHGLPPAWIGVGDLDLFLDENRSYARRLERAGTPVTYVEVPGAPHGFDAVRPEAPPSRAFVEEQARFLREVLTHRAVGADAP